MQPEISIVIPVYNSSGILPELARQIAVAIEGKFDYELILVDDCSSDHSWEIILALSEEQVLKALRLRKNSGQDNAILAGMSIAKGNFVVVMDDDLQHDPKDIPKLYETCKKGFDVCFANFISKEQSLLKNAGSALHGKMAEYLINKPRSIYLSPFKIIRSGLIPEILKFKGPFPYVDGIILTLTSSITQINCVHHTRHSGNGNFSMRKSSRVFLNLMTGFSVKPLRLLMISGLFTLLAGLALGAYYIGDYFINQHRIEGWITLVVLVLFFGGFTIFGLGLLGEYIARIYLTTNNRPLYSVAEMISSVPHEN